MTAMGIFMGPVQHAASGIPLILTNKRYPVTFFQMRDARGKVNIMGHQQTLPGRKPENKLLVPDSLPIIRKHSYDYPLSADLNAASSCSAGRTDRALPGSNAPIF